MRRVALLCPTKWDRTILSRSSSMFHSRFDVVPFGADVEHEPGSFHANRFIDETVATLSRELPNGVTSSSDYPGILVSAFVADDLGLPGPSPSAVLSCSHKYYARLAQARVAPEATPRFGLVHPDGISERYLPLPFPFFVKPVKSWFSQYAKQVANVEELADYARSPGLRRHLSTFVQPFNDLLERHGGYEIDGRWLIAEEVLVGRQVTLEGYILSSRLEPVGIVDSFMYGRTLSFRYFGYPSTLITSEVAARMLELASRVLLSMGFDNGLFNIEFMYNEAVDSVHIIEVNPRMCAQFADLMESVQGVNTYETLFSIAVGDDPLPGLGGAYNVAASFALRHFGDAEIVSTPGDAEIAAVHSLLPVTSVYSPYTAGQLLSESDYEYDGTSYRYGVVNIAGNDWPSIFNDFVASEQLLGFHLRPVA